MTTGGPAVRSAIAALALSTVSPGLSGQTANGGDRAAASTACRAGPDAIALVRTHAARYPLMETADIYKLLHQAVLGSEHAVTDLAGARAWLDREIAELEPGPPEPLIDPLGAAGSVVRIHLRPFLEAGGDPDRLAEAFALTADRVSAGPTDLGCALEAAVAGLATDGAMSAARDLERFAAARLDEGYPAVHHSDAFAAAYGPAYRVIAHDLVESALEGASLPEGHP
ncbi:MAG: hypothetical protein R3195_10005 [Gemmatimonadota bacterium]|nr:hypothetical protein [Gemmatimonadota bacterium]